MKKEIGGLGERDFSISDLGFWIVEWGSRNRIKYGNREIGIFEQLR